MRKTSNLARLSADLNDMYDARAQALQTHAVQALSDLRAWLWAHHGQLVPADMAAVSPGQAQRYAAYLDWYTRIDEALVALDEAGRALELNEPAAFPSPAEPAPETLRFSAPCPPTVRSVSPHPMIAIAPPSKPPSTLPLSAPATVRHAAA